MLVISTLGLLVGIIHSKHVHLFWIAIGSLAVVFWIGALNYLMGHSALHTLREGVYAAWSMEIGLLAGLLLDRLVLHRKTSRSRRD
jgi:hypothetical protein